MKAAAWATLISPSTMLCKDKVVSVVNPVDMVAETEAVKQAY